MCVHMGFGAKPADDKLPKAVKLSSGSILDNVDPWFRRRIVCARSESVWNTICLACQYILRDLDVYICTSS